MEHLELYAAWLENERKIFPLLEELKPLLDKRHELESKDPRLVLLRDERTVPGESEPPRLASSAGLLGDLRPTTLLQGSREPLVGQPDRPIPSREAALKAMTKAAKNKRKHAKEKERKKAKKEEEAKKSKKQERVPAPEDPMLVEKDPSGPKKLDN